MLDFGFFCRCVQKRYLEDIIIMMMMTTPQLVVCVCVLLCCHSAPTHTVILQLTYSPLKLALALSSKSIPSWRRLSPGLVPLVKVSGRQYCSSFRHAFHLFDSRAHEDSPSHALSTSFSHAPQPSLSAPSLSLLLSKNDERMKNNSDYRTPVP